jgi:hypothetical protein
MAFVEINSKVKLVLTKYGKEKLIEGKLNFKYFSFSDDGVNYELSAEPNEVIDTQGDVDTTLYNGNKSPIIYKK